MDAIKLESWSYLKQQILRQIYCESTQMGLQPLSHPVIDAVFLHRGSCVELFTENLSHAAHVEHSSLSKLGEWFSTFPHFHVTPQMTSSRLDGRGGGAH